MSFIAAEPGKKSAKIQYSLDWFAEDHWGGWSHSHIRHKCLRMFDCSGLPEPMTSLWRRRCRETFPCTAEVWLVLFLAKVTELFSVFHQTWLAIQSCSFYVLESVKSGALALFTLIQTAASSCWSEIKARCVAKMAAEMQDLPTRTSDSAANLQFKQLWPRTFLKFLRHLEWAPLVQRHNTKHQSKKHKLSCSSMKPKTPKKRCKELIKNNVNLCERNLQHVKSFLGEAAVRETVSTQLRKQLLILKDIRETLKPLTAADWWTLQNAFPSPPGVSR